MSFINYKADTSDQKLPVPKSLYKGVMLFPKVKHSSLPEFHSKKFEINSVHLDGFKPEHSEISDIHLKKYKTDPFEHKTADTSYQKKLLGFPEVKFKKQLNQAYFEDHLDRRKKKKTLEDMFDDSLQGLQEKTVYEDVPITPDNHEEQFLKKAKEAREKKTKIYNSKIREGLERVKENRVKIEPLDSGPNATAESVATQSSEEETQEEKEKGMKIKKGFKRMKKMKIATLDSGPNASAESVATQDETQPSPENSKEETQEEKEKKEEKKQKELFSMKS